MRSGTLFFNGTLYRKALLRFWPIWALYGAAWLLVLPLRFLTTALQGENPGVTSMAHYLEEMAKGVPGLLSFGVLAAAAAGLACAMAVFSYLYSSRSACTMHALPVRRETLFLSHYLAGLSFLLLPHLAVYVLTVGVEASLGCLELWEITLWLLVQSGTCLFFYSFAVFCAMFTGNLVALPIFYGILNFLAYVLCSLVNRLLYSFFYGFSGYAYPAVVEFLTPIDLLGSACDWNVEQVTFGGVTRTTDTWVLAGPEFIAIYAGVGVLLAAAALLVYRIRHIETAGDVVAVKVVRPIFKYGLAFCAGFSGGIWTTSILAQDGALSLTLWVIFWGVAGYFAGEMLLQKSFRVLKAWKGGVALGAVLLLLCLSVQFDWYGYETRVPEAGQVESVSVYGLGGAPYDSGTGSLELTAPEDIERVIQLHRAAIQAEPEQYDGRNTDSYLYFSLTYYLSDGSTMKRSYDGLPLREADLETEGTLTWTAEQMTGNREYVAQMYGFQEVEQGRLVEAYLEQVWNTQTRSYETVYIDGSAQRLWEAVKQDFAEGTIGVRYLLEDSQKRGENTCITDLYFSVEVPGEPSAPGDEAASTMTGYDWCITLTPNATHTLTLLHELGALDDTHVAPAYQEYIEDTEYSSWERGGTYDAESIAYELPAETVSP